MRTKEFVRKKVFGIISMMQLLPLILIFSDACIEPLAIDFPDIPSRLVVDGLVTDQSGPYEVRLFYTTRLDSTLKRPVWATGATVFIKSTDGESEQLLEVSSGIYQTDPSSTFKGEVGRSYFLRIVMESKEYITEPQEMLPAGVIDDVSLEFQSEAVDSGEPVEPLTYDGFKILVSSHGEGNEPTLFRWRWIGTYKFRSFPELRIEGGRNGPIPDPEPCSGYVPGPGPGGIVQVAPCTCCICWAMDYNQNAEVTDNRFIADNTFENILIGLLPVTGLNFYEKYHLEVQQLSLSEQVYEFWRLIEMQQGSSGNIFQPNSIKIRGNIKCTTNPDEEVLGVFSVSAIVSTSMFIYPSDIPVPIPAQKVVPTDCRTFENSTTTQPAFW